MFLVHAYAPERCRFSRDIIELFAQIPHELVIHEKKAEEFKTLPQIFYRGINIADCTSFFTFIGTYLQRPSKNYRALRGILKQKISEKNMDLLVRDMLPLIQYCRMEGEQLLRKHF